MLNIRFILLGFVFVMLLGFSPSQAQTDTILTLAVPQWQETNFSNDIFADFETAHPNITVQVVTLPEGTEFIPPAAFGLEEHLDILRHQAEAGDVILIDRNSLSVEATRAGFFLNIYPLVAADPVFNIADYYPAIFDAFRWDDGLWALPAGAAINTLIYDSARFDEIGLVYPNASWTLDDVARAADALATRDTDDTVTAPGLAFTHPLLLLRGLLGYPLHDVTLSPQPPALDDPTLASLLDQWMVLEERGVVSSASIFLDGASYDDFPITVSPLSRLTTGENTLQAAPLPGGGYQLDVRGFAVSGGTPYPELAYELVTYLTTQPHIQVLLGVDIPAQASLLDDPATQGLYVSNSTLRPLILDAASMGYGQSELRFLDYITMAMNTINQTDIDATGALQLAQQRALDNMQGAEEYASIPLVVERPSNLATLSQGEIQLNFVMEGFSPFLPNQNDWDRVIEDFTTSDPEVSAITFGPFVQEADCFYSSFAYNGTHLTQEVLDLGPLLNADPTFNRDDYLPGVINSMQQDNHIWGLPITINPAVLLYQHDFFTQMGLAEPQPGWNTQEMQFVLEELNAYYGDGLMPFAPEATGVTYILMLMAAYDGVAYDTRTIPPTLRLDDQDAQAAIQQIKWMVDAGLIAYPGFTTVHI